MEEIQKIISNYQAKGKQERGDQQQMIKSFSLLDDLLTRENGLAHFTSSAFIINQKQTKTLFIHHKIYNAWGWCGGHADGESQLSEVALREAKEETGLVNLEFLSKEIASLDILSVPGHEKNGKWVSAHQHLSVVYVLVADEHEKLVQNQEETNGIKWIPFEQIHQISGEVELLPIYDKCLKFIESVKIKDLLREDAPNNKTMLQ